MGGMAYSFREKSADLEWEVTADCIDDLRALVAEQRAYLAERTQAQVSVDSLDLCIRTRTALSRAGIRFVHELAAMTGREITDLQNLGAVGLHEIREELARLGMKLADEMPAVR